MNYNHGSYLLIPSEGDKTCPHRESTKQMCLKVKREILVSERWMKRT